MSDESIIDNLRTFLVAGHETTAGTLAFVLYNVVKYPEVCRKAQQEVDEVVSTGAIKLEHVSKLKYINALIRETMRLNAPITAFAREAVGDQVIGGKYLIKKDTQIVCFLTRSQSDPAVWGPRRARVQNPAGCWTTTSTGNKKNPRPLGSLRFRAAGLLRPALFAWQRRWSRRGGPDLYLRAISREGLSPAQLEARLAGAYGGGGNSGDATSPSPRPGTTTTRSAEGRKISIYYGSNSGTCEFMAQRLAANASAHGYSACVDILDAAKEALPTTCPVVIVAASYEGQPTHNASHFVNWIENLEGTRNWQEQNMLSGDAVSHSDWAETYQKVPTLIDAQLERLGASRMVPMGSTNAKDRDMFSDFETWEDHTLWPAIKQQFGGPLESSEDPSSSSAAPTSSLQVTFTTPRASDLRQDVQESLVLDARSLTRKTPETVGVGAGSGKRQLEIQLPSGTRYAAGDYLAVLPHNPKETVGRVMRRFRLAWDAHVSIAASAAHPTTLPTGVSLPVSEVLGSYVELNQVATKRNITALGQLAEDTEIKEQLLRLAATDKIFEEEVRSKYLSVLGILERFPDLHIPFGCFLSMLPPIRVRQYSISSSPLAKPGSLTLTYSVLDAPAYSGVGRHVGAASSYLAGLLPGDRIQAAVRAAAGGFHLPRDPATTPIVCIAAGTGVAPFRAFMQERWVLSSQSSDEDGGQHQKKEELAPALLFFGCRDPAEDDLYRDEFDAWERAGVVTVYRAYSRLHRRDPDTNTDTDQGAAADNGDGCRYVQDRLWRERRAVADLWRRDARFYVCGASRMARAVKGTLVRIIQDESERTDGRAMTEEEAGAWFDRHRNERFATDVFD
ncbi:Bifunctional P-450:NADPH-P450 reductase [Apiospora marii]|uniref:Bifunctional P-450:NADPH-P450 reductase n=1 Tax=Apiospora marii TaxID=335849 RepID=A0ABR1RKJ3_9PEZI